MERIRKNGLFCIACGTVALIINFITGISDLQAELDLRKIIAPTRYDSFTEFKASFRSSIQKHSNCKQHFHPPGHKRFEQTSFPFFEQNYSSPSKIVFENGHDFDLALQSALSEYSQCKPS